MLASRSRIRFLAAALLIGGIFLAFAGDGLRASFTPDDMMNLYGAWAVPLSALLHTDRPLGALFYRVLYEVFGFHALPFRVAAFTLLLANLGLLYGFVRRLAASREIGALACLLAAYHAHLADLYYNTGTIYDLLCCFFVLLAFLGYLRIRQAGRYPSWKETAGLLVLYVLALGSKEMAVALPLWVALYEGIYQREKLREWLARGAYFLWLAVPLTALYLAVKLTGAHPMTANPDYAPHFSLHAYLMSWKHYLGDLFYGAIEFNSAKLAAFWALTLAFAALARRRELWFSWFAVMAGVLPFIFIPHRGLYVMYVALPGCYLYGASALEWLRDDVLRRFPRWAAALEIRPEQLALFLLAALLLIPAHWHEKPLGDGWVEDNLAQVRTVLDPLNRRYPTLPHGARILFLSDPYDPNDWFLTSLFRLRYHDDSIQVDRVKSHPALAAEAAHYDHVFTLDARGLKEVRDRLE